MTQAIHNFILSSIEMDRSKRELFFFSENFFLLECIKKNISSLILVTLPIETVNFEDQA